MHAHIEPLWVPSDARMSRRGANSLRSDKRTPKPPAHPVLLGKPERGGRSRSTPSTYQLPSFRHDFSRNQSFLRTLDICLHWYDDIVGFDLLLIYPPPFELLSTASLDRIKRGLSEQVRFITCEFRSADIS